MANPCSKTACRQINKRASYVTVRVIWMSSDLAARNGEPQAGETPKPGRDMCRGELGRRLERAAYGNCRTGIDTSKIISIL